MSGPETDQCSKEVGEGLDTGVQALVHEVWEKIAIDFKDRAAIGRVLEEYAKKFSPNMNAADLPWLTDPQTKSPLARQMRYIDQVSYTDYILRVYRIMCQLRYTDQLPLRLSEYQMANAVLRWVGITPSSSPPIL